MDTEHVVEAEERTPSELYPTETSSVSPITALDSTSAASASVNALSSLAATPVKVKAVKYKRSLTMDQFAITQGNGVVLVNCIHYKVLASTRSGTVGQPGTTNPTRCGTHLESCFDFPEAIRIISAKSSGKEAKKAKNNSVSAPEGYTSTSTTVEVHSALAMARAASSPAASSSSSSSSSSVSIGPSSTKTGPKMRSMTQGSIKQWGHEMTKRDAEVVIRAEMEANVYRFEPYSRMLCPMVRGSIIQRLPGIKPYYPESYDMLWAIALDIDRDVTEIPR